MTLAPLFDPLPRDVEAVVREALSPQSSSARYVAVNGGGPDRDDLWCVEDTHRGNELVWFDNGLEAGARETARAANAGEIEL